jgi:UDP-glucose 4-epimerase
MIYGPGSKGNFPRLIKLAAKTPIFPAFHNQRSMLYIDNLCEFIRLIIEEESNGTFFPQNAEYVDTAELVKQLAELQGKKIYMARWMVPFVYLASPFLQQVNKMFGSLTYEKQMSKEYKNQYQIVGLEETLAKVCVNQ